jgi:hypothetical protein
VRHSKQIGENKTKQSSDGKRQQQISSLFAICLKIETEIGQEERVVTRKKVVVCVWLSYGHFSVNRQQRQLC